jgi:hypothetical protein
VTVLVLLGSVTTVLRLPPSMIVVVAPAPRIVKLIEIVRFSVYVAAATVIVSPDAASAIACPIVLQAALDDVQLLVSLPDTPLTYQVLAASAGGPERKTKARASTPLSNSR